MFFRVNICRILRPLCSCLASSEESRILKIHHSSSSYKKCISRPCIFFIPVPSVSHLSAQKHILYERPLRLLLRFVFFFIPYVSPIFKCKKKKISVWMAHNTAFVFLCTLLSQQCRVNPCKSGGVGFHNSESKTMITFLPNYKCEMFPYPRLKAGSRTMITQGKNPVVLFHKLFIIEHIDQFSRTSSSNNIV